MTLNKKDFLFLFGLLFSLFIFYPELFFAKAASLIGDHWEQHYPWAYLMDEVLKQGKLPFWTPLIHCGFPIAAEGQIGVFYLPNLLLYLLLPFQWAYSYMNIFHFLVAAWSTYLYARVIKLSGESSFISAFIFTFGTAYGGAYYNITSLKTIAWFPLCLFLFEQYFISKKFRFIFFLALILSQLLIAGYLQVALLLFLIFGLYVVLRIFFFSETNLSLKVRLKTLMIIAFGVLLALLLAFPQIYLTFQLALKSNRVGLTEDYAYIGSMSPLALATFLIAMIQGFCRGNSLYGGVFSVILILFAVCSKKVRKEKLFKLWMWMVVISILLSLGRWSPLYVAIIKLTHFYSFRTPMKFLVFICFSLAILSGFGFEEALKGRNKPNPSLNSAVSKFYFAVVLFSIILFTVIYLFLTVLRSYAIQFGEWVIRSFVYGHIGRPHTFEEYTHKLNSFLDLFLTIYSFHYFWAVWTVIMIVISIVLISFIKLSGKFRSAWLVVGFLFLFSDLYNFAWFDIKKDFNSYSAISDHSPMIDRLVEEKNSGRLNRLYGFRKADDQLPLIPSVNMLYGIEDIGAYSPFIIKRYFETIGTFGNVNDSNAAYSPTSQYVLERLKLLSALGVSHILSKKPLDQSFLKLILHDDASDSYLYWNDQEHDKAFFVAKVESYSNWQDLKAKLLEPGFNPRETLLLERSEFQRIYLSDTSLTRASKFKIKHEKQENDHEIWNIETEKAGFFVVMDSMYPGWHASVNGKKASIFYAYGLFRAVWLDGAGTYEIDFRFSPFDSHLD